MLYQSLHVRQGEQPFPRSVLKAPEIAHYLDDFGSRPGDDAELVLTLAGQRIGAAWCRRLGADDRGFGYVADEIPELGMAVTQEWRGQGIGRRLLSRLLERHPSLSLSVDNENTAARALYRSAGFDAVDELDGSTTMLRTPSRPSADAGS